MNNNLDYRGLIIRVITFFVKGNYSYDEIASFLNIPISKVEECVNDWITIRKIYPEDSREIIKIIESKRTAYLAAKLASKDKMPLLNLSSFYPDEKRQYIFLRHLALTLHLKLYSLAYLFQIDPNVLYQNLKKYNRSSVDALNYLFGADSFNQELAVSTALDYCRSLSEASKMRNQNEILKLIHQIDDYYPKIIKAKKEENNDLILSFEEIGYVLNYQIKYHLSYSQISKIFHINRTIYGKKVRKFIEGNRELQDKYERLVEYYTPKKGRQ